MSLLTVGLLLRIHRLTLKSPLEGNRVKGHNCTSFFVDRFMSWQRACVRLLRSPLSDDRALHRATVPSCLAQSLLPFFNSCELHPSFSYTIWPSNTLKTASVTSGKNAGARQKLCHAQTIRHIIVEVGDLLEVDHNCCRLLRPASWAAIGNRANLHLPQPTVKFTAQPVPAAHLQFNMLFRSPSWSF